MAERIIMPKAGMAMETGTIIAWLKDVGEAVAYGEPLLEIETDKTTMQVEAMSTGYLIKKLYDADDEVPVTTTIGYIGELGEEAPDENAPEQAIAPAPAVQADKSATILEPAQQNVVKDSLRATPAARRLAQMSGVNLDELNTGDILRARDVPAIKHDTASAISATPLAARGKTVALNGMRKTIARRMQQSHTEIPPVTLNSQADVTELAQMRTKINESGQHKISFNDFVIKACAMALLEFPNINATYAPEGIILHENVNIGIAVALDEGLLVPVLSNAQDYSLRVLAQKSKALATAARAGELLPDAYSGGTFTVSNLGMYGITSFSPIINLPEAAILGVCAINESLTMTQEGSIETRKYMGLSLTFDHRCIDGAGGAKFLQHVVKLLQNPLELLL
ncbi:2-oxo acid dehydrogenase subunit E2 [Eubacteriales bacterium OttesenSCG-928-K08]|nr:2-oxo acid dehydrogenase subunit E2 [Eubacteriales bacterium OttesenSCG-928-K08]